MAQYSHPKDAVIEVGERYVENPKISNASEERIKTAYRGIAETVETLYEQIPVPVVFQEADPYENYRHMALEVGNERKLRIYNQHTDHPYFSHEEQLMFRAVHDWWGHLKHDVDFSPTGEYLKWRNMNRHFDTMDEKLAMFAEVVGQVGAVHYLPDGFDDDRYVQRAGIAPKGWVTTMEGAIHG